MYVCFVHPAAIKIKRLQSKRKLDSDLASFHTFGNAGVDRLSPIFGPFSIHAWQWTRVFGLQEATFTSQELLGNPHVTCVRGIMFVKETFRRSPVHEHENYRISKDPMHWIFVCMRGPHQDYMHTIHQSNSKTCKKFCPAPGTCVTGRAGVMKLNPCKFSKNSKLTSKWKPRQKFKLTYHCQIPPPT